MGKISDEELLERLRNDPSKSLNDIEKEIREEEEIERWKKENEERQQKLDSLVSQLSGHRIVSVKILKYHEGAPNCYFPSIVEIATDKGLKIKAEALELE